jgi:hypothetical protein
MSGQEVPHQPHLAVTATPWPGSAAIYSSDRDAGYNLNRQIAAPSVIGETLSPLFRARPAVWDRGAPLRVRMSGGVMSSVDPGQVLNGANLMAIGDGSSDRWELFQFAEAVLVAPDTYDLTLRLRGQAGSDAVMPDSWPAGSLVVLMDGAPKQIAMAASERDLARHYRIGPARRGYDDPSYEHRIEAFAGVGLRPLAPAHLRARRLAGAGIDLAWIRRTRIEGDSWAGVEVPLGEAREAYLLRVVQGGAIRREVTTFAAGWTYGAAMQAADAVAAPYEIHVAQLSDAFGPGPFTRITIDD